MPVCGNYLFFELPKKIVLNPKDGLNADAGGDQPRSVPIIRRRNQRQNLFAALLVVICHLDQFDRLARIHRAVSVI